MAVSQPALLGSTQSRKRQQHPQFMFPDLNAQMNFSEGRVVPPSNNAGQQNLFQRDDPFAQKIPGTIARGTSSVVDATRGIDPIGTDPLGGQAGVILAEPVAGQQEPEALDRAFTLSGDQAKLTKPVTPLDILENPKGAAAQLLGSTLVNNPFISAKGRQALREGRVPQLNDIQPAFYRFTNPRDIASLQGLIAGSSKTAPTLETQEFFTNVFRAPGL